MVMVILVSDEVRGIAPTFHPLLIKESASISRRISLTFSAFDAFEVKRLLHIL